MAKIVIDGVDYEVNPDNNLLQECLSQGLDLPYFCWHPCMGSVGACRQCAVIQYRDEDDDKGMLVMACMTPPTDGMIISIEDEQAKSFRSNVIESLMISHPHDCPVCEEGGECHLQDMTLMSGHNYRRYDKEKVTHRNQYLGPFIGHEMNRCITCYRCVRYYDDYAGGTDLSAQASHHHVYFGRHEEGVLESEFSGNLVEVCPTGVFTDRTFSENYTRKWDLQTAPSICTGCAVGCNTTPGERYGTLRRITNRYNSDVNGYFLCDRGRFGYGYSSSDQRFADPLQRKNETAEIMDDSAVQSMLDGFSSENTSVTTIGIGSPRASTEANYALRCLVGADNFFSGMSDEEFESANLILQLNKDKAFHSPSIREIEQADAILIVGEDVTNTAPRIALALRQSVRNKAMELADQSRIPRWQDAAVRELAQHDRSPLSILSGYKTRLDDVADDEIIDSIPRLASFAQAIAGSLSGKAEQIQVEDGQVAAVEKIAEQLKSAKRPLVIAGSSQGAELIKAAANIARALGESRADGAIDLCLLTPEVNSMGMAMLSTEENSLGAALEKLRSGEASKVVIVENDLYRRAPHGLVDEALEKAEQCLEIDQLPTATTAKADFVLPCTAFAEQESSYINYEGRAQLSFQVHRNHARAKSSWQWLSAATEEGIESLMHDCADAVPGLAKLCEILPDKSQFVGGMKVPRQSHRYSGRTAMKSHLGVHEPKQAVDSQSVMSFSMEGISSQKDASILASSWSPQWNSNQSISKFQSEVNGELKQGHTGKLVMERNAEGAYLEVSVSEDSSAELQLSRAHQIFGSDELSSRSSVIKQRMVGSYLGISEEDARSKRIRQGDSIAIVGVEASLSACIRSSIKNGSAVIYCDETMDSHSLPRSINISKSNNEVQTGIKGLIISDLMDEDN
ncbi:MAG: NADH-quinone oxidoreductase subunit NuoG [Gammaproteobacteria bacterium]|nr:NADH-quinone oxidoreductase subunit NuoG [Gammaproteobacteria bacterium]